MRSSPRESESPDEPLREGSVIDGKYRVERVVGRGGMGLVVVARHEQLDERVAIKLLLPRVLRRPDAAARFLREGRAAARIRSEHVARVYDAGRLPGGEPYLVLEYLRGRDLRSQVERDGPLPVDVAVGYVLQACEGLAEAHAFGIVHRDLKPANLFLTRRTDGSPVVKIIDFGVSKVRERPGGADPAWQQGAHLTKSDVAIGTPHYMAPEQMRDARHADPRSDIFSLGATLYGLVTGTVPFPGDTMVAVYDRILAGPPSLRAARPDAPAELAAIVERCLRVDPSDRPPDVGALATDLSPFAAPWARLAAERALRITHERPPASLQEDTLQDPDDAATEGGTSGIRSSGQARGTALDTHSDVSVRASVDSLGATHAAREPTWLEEAEGLPPIGQSATGLSRPAESRPVESRTGGPSSGEAQTPQVDESSSRSAQRPRWLALAAGSAVATAAVLVWLGTRGSSAAPDRDSLPVAPSAAETASAGVTSAAAVPAPVPSPSPSVLPSAMNTASVVSAPSTASNTTPPTTGALAPRAPTTARSSTRPLAAAAAAPATAAPATAAPTATQTRSPRWTPGPMDTPD